MIPTISTRHVNVTKPQSAGTIRRLFTKLDGDNYVLEMDWSSIDNFLTCWKKSEYALVFSRTTGRTAALTYGTAYHLALEQYYRGERDIEKLLAAAQPEFDTNPPALDEYRNPEFLRKSLTEYIEKYSKEDSFLIQTMDGAPMIEQPFATPLCELVIKDWIPYNATMLLRDEDGAKIVKGKLYVDTIFVQWTGVIDILAADGSEKWPVVIDHKTTSVGGPTYYDQFDLAQQFRGYCWAAGKIMEQPVTHAMANVIEGRKETKTGKSRDYQRKWINYTTEQVERWQIDMTAIVTDLVSKLRTGHFPENTHSCVGKFGKCDFFDVCRLPENMRQTMLQSASFTNNVWNPLQ